METYFIGHECYLRKNKFSTGNVTSAKISQQILGCKPAITGRQENNLSGQPKLEPVKTCHLGFIKKKKKNLPLRVSCKIVVKMLWMYHLSFSIFCSIIGRQENNLSGWPKLEPVTTCHLGFIVKLL